MAPKFGTSGLRGLVTELTDELVTDYVRAFLTTCPHGGAVHIGWDLRPSSEGIAAVVAAEVVRHAVQVRMHGALPTPALALAASQEGAAAVMVTGSHIPADRNGLKFYTPDGEILKQDEARILAGLGAQAPEAAVGAQHRDTSATEAYLARYVAGFGTEALTGLRIGVYQHSSVARDLLSDLIARLGGTAVPLARSDIFVPVDTEAVDPETRAQLAQWCAEHRLDALVSTDGDGDRPMLADHQGRVVPGDVLGALTARMLGAKVVCTPVSSNTMVRAMPEFAHVHLTRIGSPFVIAAMQEAGDVAVVGYEANGGFLLGFEAHGPAGRLAPLATRDSVLPMIAPLAQARALGQPLADLVAALPPRFTAADRITGVETEAAQALLGALTAQADARAAFFDRMGPEKSMDLTDGLRITFASGDVVHLRPSGNAPEFRCYAEAATQAQADALVAQYLKRLRARLT